MTIVTRSEWGAQPPRSRHAIATPTPRLWLHHTAGNEHGALGMRQIQAFHMRPVAAGGRGWSDIAYSLVVDPDTLTVYEGRGIGIAGGHTKGDNTSSHAICVMGNFENRPVTPQLVRLLGDLVAHGRERGWWGDLTGGHRQAPGASTACPGRHLQAVIPQIRTIANMEDDMPLTEADWKRLGQLVTWSVAAELEKSEDRLYERLRVKAQAMRDSIARLMLPAPPPPE